MKVRDLIEKLLLQDMHDEVRVVVSGELGRYRSVEVDSVERLNAEQFPHTAIITVQTPTDAEETISRISSLVKEAGY